MPSPILIRSLNKFKSEVLPAPDAPIIKVVYPGRQYPVQSFNMCSYFEGASPLAISSFVLVYVTVKLTLSKLIFIISELKDFCFCSLCFSSARVPELSLYIEDIFLSRWGLSGLYPSSSLISSMSLPDVASGVIYPFLYSRDYVFSKPFCRGGLLLSSSTESNLLFKSSDSVILFRYFFVYYFQ